MKVAYSSSSTQEVLEEEYKIIVLEYIALSFDRQTDWLLHDVRNWTDGVE